MTTTKFEKAYSTVHNTRISEKFESYSKKLHKLLNSTKITKYQSYSQNHDKPILLYYFSIKLTEEIKKEIQREFFNKLEKNFDKLEKRLDRLYHEVRELNTSLSIHDHKNRIAECLHLALSSKDNYFINCNERWLNKPLDD